VALFLIAAGLRVVRGRERKRLEGATR